MARHRRTDDDGGAMDSLLDTMTNVVGILVIVLVVTQLGVGDAVQRISQTIQLDPEKLAENKDRLEEIKLEKQTLVQNLDSLKPQDQQDTANQINQIQLEIDENALKLKNIQSKNKAKEDSLAKAEKEKEEEQEKRKQLEDQISTSLQNVASLRAKLDATPERVVLPAKVLKLPNPRAAPEGVQAITLICDNNRVYPMNFHQIQLAARDRAKEIIRTKKLLKDAAKGIDAERFIREFTRKPFRNEFFDVNVSALNNGHVRLTLHPKENAGARMKDLENRNSQFQKDLRSLDPQKYFVRFFVSSDSFDAYLTGRAVAEKYNFAVGWIPQGPDWKFAGNMGGEILLGPPENHPKPNPNKNPPPKATDDID